MSPPERAVSPRISALAYAVSNERAGALDEFWAEIGRAGAPLIEPIAGDGGRSLVTFVWRSTGAEQAVALLGGPNRPGELIPLVRLGSSDLFHLTYRLPNELRNAYWFVTDPPPSLNATSAEQWDELQTRRAVDGFLRPDPLNLHRVPYRSDPLDPSTEAAGDSVLELPAAPRLPWEHRPADAARGTLTAHRFTGTLLETERSLWVYTPAGLDAADTPCDVLIVFDAQRSIDAMAIPTTLDHLIARGQVRPTIAVFVENPTGTRVVELPCHEPFADFLASELMPWLADRYPVTDDRTRTTLAGASFGGLAASFGAFRHPERFGNVLSHSGSYWWELVDREERYVAPEERVGGWLTAQFAAQPAMPIRFYLDAGTLEDSDTGISLMRSVREFRDVLVERAYHVTHREFTGGHSWECWRRGFADGLLSLVGTESAGR